MLFPASLYIREEGVVEIGHEQDVEGPERNGKFPDREVPLERKAVGAKL